MDLDLKNKKVLITGASRGIGLGIANSFLTENANVCIVSRGSKNLFDNEMKLKNEYGADKVWAAKCDCTKTGDLEKLKKRVKKEWGSLDVVVVNVGSGESVLDILPNTDDWKKTWDITLNQPFKQPECFYRCCWSQKGFYFMYHQLLELKILEHQLIILQLKQL